MADTLARILNPANGRERQRGWAQRPAAGKGREAVLLPVPDELLGSRLRAVICADGPGGLTREEVLDHCRQRLPGYMVPDMVEFRQRCPGTPTARSTVPCLWGPGK